MRTCLLGLDRGFLSACCVIVEETRAWANFEAVEALQHREQSDWARFSRLHRKSEKRQEDPNDLLLKAERAKPRRSRRVT